ncbi:MAG: glycoside hydrolase [Candidatus Omnitrophica bacterium]|nr:glycoside hydrolase [Candidatus Omnitrophota bacterium]
MKKFIEVLERAIIYENPIPNFVSRHAYFPGITMTPSGDIIVLFMVADAFESMNSSVFVSRSKDRGKTWILEGPMLKKTKYKNIGPCLFKPALLKDGSLIATGYGFYRNNPKVFVNPETGGLPKGLNLVSFSLDEGKTWSEHEIIPLSRPETLEISGTCIQLKSGEIILPGSTFPIWDGSRPSGRIGVLLRSKDNGKSWNDKTIFYRPIDRNVSAYETRACQTENGRIVILMWLLDEVKGESLTNHIVVSYDKGFTWSSLMDTGIPGQSSNLISLQDNFLLSVHCYREGDVGLYVHLIDFKGDNWKVIATEKIWGDMPSIKIGGIKDMKGLKFGQPSFLRVGEEEFLIVYWAVEDCIGKIFCQHIHIKI